MAKILDRIEVVTDYKHLQIREITDSGGFHRRVLTSDMDVSGEVKEIKDKAKELWTPAVKTAWATKQTQKLAERPAEESE